MKPGPSRRPLEQNQRLAGNSFVCYTSYGRCIARPTRARGCVNTLPSLVDGADWTFLVFDVPPEVLP